MAQLHSAADYILGKKKEQLSSSVIKTKSELYNAFGCNRDNFANSVLMTRKMHQKKYSRFFPRDILAQKLSISFHPEDNDKLTYAEAYKMAEDFAREFFWKKGFEVLFAVHVDTEHVHVHFLVNNCNQGWFFLSERSEGAGGNVGIFWRTVQEPGLDTLCP